MRYRFALVAPLLALVACNGSSTPVAPIAALPPPSTVATVPANIVATNGYSVSVFARPSGPTKPDSLAAIGANIFVGFGDAVGPGGAPSPSGVTQTEVLQYDLTGRVVKTYEVPGHNDGLMSYDDHTLWAMSNEDGNPQLTVIDIASGVEQTYLPQASLLDATGNLPHGGGLDDMVLLHGLVYVSASNASPSATASCPVDSSTPGCPNGVVTVPVVYTLSLSPSAKTFNLTPVVASGTTATNLATKTSGTLNVTDADSEVVTPDGSTLLVDGQADSELTSIQNPGPTQTLAYLPLTLAGSPTAVDDTRFVATARTFLLLADTSQNTIYRIDGAFAAGDAYSAAPTALAKLNLTSGVLTPVVSGFAAPHGLLFVSATGS